MIDDDDGIDLAELDQAEQIEVRLTGPDGAPGPEARLWAYAGESVLGVAMAWVGGAERGPWSSLLVIDGKGVWYVYSLDYSTGVACATGSALIV